ncbi:hypothetical protein ACIOJE_07700 [Kitasatospora sp. NPDC087861]|uniref:hypothetical protein n=1 Tax=Kitasatospora sp. NPDC087861 TaxID=3364070 RepID=UPI003809C243
MSDDVLAVKLSVEACGINGAGTDLHGGTRMKRSLRQRVVRAVVAGALAVGGLALTAGPVHADTGDHWVTLNTTHYVGLYWSPWTANKDVHRDLAPGDQVNVNCWTVGEDIANQGDVWYHITTEYYWSGIGRQFFNDYVYGAYVDNYDLWHARGTNGLPQCS